MPLCIFRPWSSRSMVRRCLFGYGIRSWVFSQQEIVGRNRHCEICWFLIWLCLTSELLMRNYSTKEQIWLTRSYYSAALPWSMVYHFRTPKWADTTILYTIIILYYNKTLIHSIISFITLAFLKLQSKFIDFSDISVFCNQATTCKHDEEPKSKTKLWCEISQIFCSVNTRSQIFG